MKNQPLSQAILSQIVGSQDSLHRLKDMLVSTAKRKTRTTSMANFGVLNKLCDFYVTRKV